MKPTFAFLHPLDHLDPLAIVLQPSHSKMKIRRLSLGLFFFPDASYLVLGHFISIWPQYPRYFFARVHKQQLRSPDVRTHVVTPTVPTMVLFLCWLDVCKPVLEMKSHCLSWETFVLP